MLGNKKHTVMILLLLKKVSRSINIYLICLTIPQINAYLCKLLPADNYKVSNVTVLCAEEIKENIENGLPIFQFGYLPFAITKQHHGLFLHRSGKVFFGERDVFQEDSVSDDLTWRYYNVKTASWAEAKFDSASVAEILVTLSTDFDVLITDLLHERLGETIDKLNHQFAISREKQNKRSV